MSELSLEGGCQCGEVRYRATGSPVMAALCHCSMCRRANAAPTVAWAMFQTSQVEFTRQLPTIYESSPGARRGFCGRCGTQISFAAEYIPGLVDLTIASLDDASQISPTFHYWHSERLPWMHFADRMPRYAEFPPTE